MLDPKLKEKLAKGYSRLGAITYKIALNMKKGKDSYPTQIELYKKGIKLRLVLKFLFRHITFDGSTPVLWNITEAQVNTMMRYLEWIGDLDKLPASPTMLPTPKPIVFNQGPPGPPGQDGLNGTDANIDVRARPGELEITVEEQVIDGVKTFDISYTPYELPLLSVEVQGTKVYEKGEVAIDKVINFVTTKGSRQVASLVIATPSDLNEDLQGVLDLNAVNDENTQPVTHFVTDALISDTKMYTAKISDGIEEVTDSDTIEFFYPFLYGATVGTSIDHYSDLSKLIAGKANRSFTFNDTDKYFWIGFPSSYGQLVRIRDQNGFVVTDAFTEIVTDVTSVGLVNDWTEEYRFYRTTLITDIVNQPYSIEF